MVDFLTRKIHGKNPHKNSRTESGPENVNFSREFSARIPGAAGGAARALTGRGEGGSGTPVAPPAAPLGAPPGARRGQPGGRRRGCPREVPPSPRPTEPPTPRHQTRAPPDPAHPAPSTPTFDDPFHVLPPRSFLITYCRKKTIEITQTSKKKSNTNPVKNSRKNPCEKFTYSCRGLSTMKIVL